MKKITQNKFQVRHQEGVPFLTVNSPEIDSMLRNLSSDEKLAQLIFYDAPDIDRKNSDSILFIIQSIKPGGLILKSDSLSTLQPFRKKTSSFGKPEPFFVLKTDNSFPDFLKDLVNFPKKQALDAVSDDSIKSLYYQKSSEIYKQLGFNFVIFPPENINQSDSFAQILQTETFQKISILQKKHIIASVYRQKFCDNDSISNLLNKNITNSEVSAIIRTENEKTQKAKSKYRKKFKVNKQYGGLIIHDFTDLTEKYQDSLLISFKNGTEIFIGRQPDKILNSLKYLLQSKKISQLEIDFRVRKILQAKYWTNSFEKSTSNPNSLKKLSSDLNLQAISRLLYSHSICILANKKNIIPIGDLKNQNIAVFTFGSKDFKMFSKVLNEYFTVSEKNFDLNDKEKTAKIKFSGYTKYIIVSDTILSDTSLLNKMLTLSKNSDVIFVNFGILENIKASESFSTVILTFDKSEMSQKYAADAIFGGISVSGRTPYNLSINLPAGKLLKTTKTRLNHVIPEEAGANSAVLQNIDSIVNDAIRRGAMPGCQVFAAKDGMIIYDKCFGTHTYNNRHAISPNDIYDLASVTKIAATTLEAMKLYETGSLKLTDNLGKFFNDTKIQYTRIKPDTIIHLDTFKYADIKDFRKILKNQDTIRINDSLFLAYDTLIATVTPKNNIFKVSIEELLRHQSGISPALPILPYILYNKEYFKALKKNAAYKKAGHSELSLEELIGLTENSIDKYNLYYSSKYLKDSAEIQIAENFYFKNNWADTLWNDTKQLKVYSRKVYQYSDVNMILLQIAMDSLTKTGIDKFLSNHFYKSLGLQTIGYQPLKRFNKNRIVPTEDEKYWRKQLLCGTVHDPSAALLGGISGNAGLFSNAEDLGVICQMWLNGGIYGGTRYLLPSTVRKFTSRQANSSRGLGFDKANAKQIIGTGASTESYGHTGFTGTCVWVDPVSKIVFVFLSNRVNPKQKNGRLNTLKVRQKVHSVVYQSFKKEK